MTHTLDTLRDIIEGRTVPNVSLALELQRQWPATINAAVAALMAHPDAQGEEASSLRLDTAARLGDTDTLLRVLGDAGCDFDNFYPDTRHDTPSTIDTIDTFLGKFTHSDPERETAALEKVMFSATTDYAATYLSGDESPDTSAQTTPSVEVEKPAAIEVQPAESPELSLSFASIMIKNHNYGKALEIIQAISLTNPEKSIYFADQIRFLRKLIINENNKQ